MSVETKISHFHFRICNHISKVTKYSIRLFCTIVTGYLSTFYMKEYLANKDIASISIKSFSLNSTAAYPAFSFCFLGESM